MSLAQAGPAGEMPRSRRPLGSEPRPAPRDCQQTLPAFALSSRTLLLGSTLPTGSPSRRALEPGRERPDPEGASRASSLLCDYVKATGGWGGGIVSTISPGTPLPDPGVLLLSMASTCVSLLAGRPQGTRDLHQCPPRGGITAPAPRSWPTHL